MATYDGTPEDDDLPPAGADTSQSMTIHADAGNDQVQGGSQGDFLYGEAGMDNLSGSSGDDLLDGGADNDYMDGGGDNDTLDGGTGADTMIGNFGDDRYYVDNAGDTVTEYTAQDGFDTVYSSVSFQLTNFVEDLYLTGTDGINGTGNGLANRITGNAGANVLNGGGGADTLTGLGGNDTYVVDNANDQVVEAAGGGAADRVNASVSYVLGAGQQVEILGTTSVAVSGAINLTGNGFAQTLYGNAGANTLNGGGAADILQGFGGNDTYVVDNAADQVLEAAGGGTADRVNASTGYALAAGQEVEILGTTSAAGTTAINLTGNAFVQTVYGNAGANFLNGHGGSDTLSGFGGSDTFSFTTGLGAGNVDHITDFSAPADTIRLAKSVFSALTAGTLDATAYKDIGDPGAVVDANDRILYDDDTGALYYDSNGSADGGRTQFAVLDNKPATLTAADFVVAA